MLGIPAGERAARQTHVFLGTIVAMSSDKDILIEFNGKKYNLVEGKYTVLELLESVKKEFKQDWLLVQEDGDKPGVETKYSTKDELVDFKKGLIFLYSPTKAPVS